MTNRTRYRTEAELKALFEQAVRAIGFYEAQRKEVLMALESLRRALNARRLIRQQIFRRSLHASRSCVLFRPGIVARS
jgi:hypothetical protein